MIITVGITTAAWLAATFLTAPESNETLVSFCRRTRPSPPLRPTSNPPPMASITSVAGSPAAS